LELHLRVTATAVPFEEQSTQKRLLLYKHGDDLRQELLAIQFIERCNLILLASGLDLKLKTFSCQPVGNNTGFIEWVRGTVPLSELCKTSGSSYPGSNEGLSEINNEMALEEDKRVPSQRHRWYKYQSLPGMRQKLNGSVVENPIQDFLRSAAYEEDAPYFVKKEVMATYVKSCAGYCVITYLLGVGDRHLDNILLHQNGHLLHCDYSFILGQDPKTYLPMRITEEMIKGFGGRDSDNFAKFIYFIGAAFLTLRRHNNLHSLFSHICNMIHANMGDVSVNQPPEEALLAMRGRFRLDLNDDDALAYIEDVVEKSITSKMWKAVDVMHSLGKHF
jgi:phosphatidylinositol 3-kinase